MVATFAFDGRISMAGVRGRTITAAEVAIGLSAPRGGASSEVR